MNLRSLIQALPRVTASGPTDVEIAGLCASSKQAAAGMMFVAVRGANQDGHRFIGDALKAGALAVVAEQAPPADLKPQVAWLHVGDSRDALARLASAFHGDPWQQTVLAGVTGTNGKTTTTFLIHHLMKSQWHRAGLMGTILVDDGMAVQPASHTTPDAVELTAALARMRDHGCRGVAMEVSSHGIDQKRVAAIGFDACVFTNLTQDHLDYHGTMEAYFQAKASWFESLAHNGLGKKPTAVINIDDARGLELANRLADMGMKVLRYGFGVHCDLRANNLRQNARGMEFELATRGKTYLVRAPFIGRFNCYNVLAALAAAIACGIRPREAVAAMAEAPQVPGRMQQVGQAGGATVFVDYAHTPDALENACRAILELQPRRLITVFGCGGDRDRTKRPLMAAAVARHSDVVVMTSDNPRSEDPQAILRDMQVGVPSSGALTIADRAEAISQAILNARSGDIVLIAGKGHETYQQIGAEKIDFDDRKVASKALRDRAQHIADQR
ncbi:MAG TPA: UDP-N-acetylmuramoyl-L-alanyl-D-glutamate--2,6-diaminopimelate ligase [Luteolibacter sp.]|nr:UDP-N-acetylmuramoyl-L-alanyl-D-glutamate--2,6-diaminopimelate ligase [Luteolibacter sp.]